MKPTDLCDTGDLLTETDLLSSLLRSPTTSKQAPAAAAESVSSVPFPAVVIGELLAMTDVGATPLVRYPGQPGSAALRARSTVDLHAPHIGASVVLMFEKGDPTRPIVMGVLRDTSRAPLAAKPGQVELDVDGERLVVQGNQQLVLRCGKASITLSEDGAIEIRGVNLVSRAMGRNRILGGSIDLN